MPLPSSPAPPLLTLVFASGASALVYQSLWLRAFGLVFACLFPIVVKEPLRARVLLKSGIVVLSSRPELLDLLRGYGLWCQWSGVMARLRQHGG